MTKQQIGDYTNYDADTIISKADAAIDQLTNQWPGTADNASAAESIELLKSIQLKILKFLKKSVR